MEGCTLVYEEACVYSSVAEQLKFGMTFGMI